MSDFRITWEAPLDTSVVDSIAIFRYSGVTSDCSVVLNDGDLVSDTIPVSQTSYDDLGAPDISQVTYGIFSKNTVGYSACALSSESVSPVLADAPTGIQNTVLSLSHAPTSIQTQDADITVGPEGLTAVWQTSSLYAVDGGHYVYPLFLSEAESNYTDSINGGSGASHTMVYNGVTYYMPNTGGTHAGTQAPSIGTYFDSGVEVERLDETDEAPRDITAQIENAVVAPDANQSPESINTKVDMDEDGVYSDVDIDDNDASVSAPPASNQSPQSINTKVDMDEDGVYSDVDIDDNDASVTSPPVANQSPQSINTKVDMDEDGVYSDVDIDDNDASVNIPPVANQSPQSINTKVDMDEDGVYSDVDPDDNDASVTTSSITTFSFKEFNNSGTVGLTSHDGYQAFYDSYTSPDNYTLDINWTPNMGNVTEGLLEMILTDDSGVSEIVYTFSGAFNDIPLFSMSPLVDDENLLLGFDSNDTTISGNTGYQNSFYVEKRDGSRINSLDVGESINLAFDNVNAFNSNTFTDPSTGNEYYYSYGVEGYAPDFRIARSSITDGQRFRLQHYYNYYDLFEIYTDGTAKSISADWGVVENMNGNLVESFTITNNSSESIPPPAPVANQSPQSINTKVDMDEDGAYSDVDIDDNDASVNIPPVANQSPTSLTAAEEQLSQGDTLTNTLATDVDLEVIYLEPGAYPPSTILTKGFYMGKYEVTQAQYEAVMTGNTDGLSATPSHFSNNPNRPVEWISWESVQIFLTRLNAQQSANIPSGWKYVLPTEAQWEYACRAGTTTAYSWGNSITSADANYGYNVNETTDVGSYAANPWGLFDMHGNVYEWCSDWWTHIPPSGYDPEGPATSTIGYRVKRGGFWGTSGTNLTSAKRFGDPPTFRNNNTGFRVALIQVTAPDANKSPTSLTAAPAPVANQSPTSLTAAEQPVAPSVGPTILTHTVIPYTPLTFVDISAATFFIGAPSDNSALKSQYQYYPSAANLGGARVDDTYGGANENYREVTLTEDYKMATTPVTRAQYLHVMSGYAGHIGELDTVAYGANPPSVKPDNFNVPVHYVSWLDAQEFVDRLNTQEPVAGWEYVLPTEAQWEYACKAVNKNQIDAGTHWYTKYWLGDTLTQADANYDATQSELAEVQQYNPNAFGLYDLIGGVKEWTSDIYASNYVDYSSDYTPLTDPAGGASYKTYDNMTQKGGLWRQTAPQVRSASRAYGGKTMKGYGTGFRVAMVPSP